MIFQEPMTSLNPCFTVGFQLTEGIAVHEGGTRAERRRRAIELLDLVGIPAPEQRLRAFPHQLSGGMNQRVMIAMAIACNPRLLIADEPTTALDVTIQAQILDLLLALQSERGMALILITHDMAVVAETAQRVVVQYAGQQAETQDGRGPVRRSPAPLYRGAAARAAGARRRHASCRPSRASCRAPPTGRRAACSTRAARTRPSAASRDEPPLAPGPRGRVRCHYPLTGERPGEPSRLCTVSAVPGLGSVFARSPRAARRAAPAPARAGRCGCAASDAASTAPPSASPPAAAPARPRSCLARASRCTARASRRRAAVPGSSAALWLDQAVGIASPSRT